MSESEDFVIRNLKGPDCMETHVSVLEVENAALKADAVNIRSQLSQIAKALAWEVPYQASLAKRAEVLKSSNDALKEENERLKLRLDKQMEMSRVLADGNSSLFDTADALKARVADQSDYILRLRKTILNATNSGAALDSGKWVFSIDDSVLNWPESLKEPTNEG